MEIGFIPKVSAELRHVQAIQAPGDEAGLAQKIKASITEKEAQAEQK